MSEIKKNPKREEVSPEDCWRLEDLYPSDQAWEADAQAIRQQLEDFVKYQGKLGESSSKRRTRFCFGWNDCMCMPARSPTRTWEILFTRIWQTGRRL